MSAVPPAANYNRTPTKRYPNVSDVDRRYQSIDADWNDILTEITRAGSTHDLVCRRYLKKLAAKTKRNIIIYYSGWLQKSNLYRTQPWDFMLNYADKNGLMSTIHEMDRDKGLDLILHTPGGDMAATESLVDYLRQMFGKNIRAIIPQIAMSGGTMIALACKEIILGKHSNLGPIDPQHYGVPAHAIKEEFERALKEVQASPTPRLADDPPGCRSSTCSRIPGHRARGRVQCPSPHSNAHGPRDY